MTKHTEKNTKCHFNALVHLSRFAITIPYIIGQSLCARTRVWLRKGVQSRSIAAWTECRSSICFANSRPASDGLEVRLSVCVCATAEASLSPSGRGSFLGAAERPIFDLRWQSTLSGGVSS